MARKTTRLESDLCKAVNDGEPRSVQLLLSQGACPDLVGRKGVASIHLAAGKETEKNTRCLKILLQHGADPNIRSSEGLTPLHIAALWGCYQNLKLLLMNGGNPNSKDNEGNTPRELAAQQENRRCAQLLQEYQGSSVENEEDDLPQFQYSVYSDQMDMSSYPESDYSFSSRSSVISDFGEAQLSSTRRSSFFNTSNIKGRPSFKGISNNRLSDIDTKRDNWNNSTSHWTSGGPSILSSTRMSAVGPVLEMQTLQEDNVCTYDVVTSKAREHSATANSRISAARRDTLPTFPPKLESRKSVSFRDVDEYFPVFNHESHKQEPFDSSQFTTILPFDLSEYSDFLDSERMATVLQKQGIDVTSPDHVYVFSRAGSESIEDMEKTVIGPCTLEDDEEEGENIKDAEENLTELPACVRIGSSSSGTDFSSCDSDHYTSALDVSIQSRHILHPTEDNVVVGCESDKKIQITSDSDSVPTEECLDSRPETTEQSPAILAIHLNNGGFKTCCGLVMDNSNKCGAEQSADDAADILVDNVDIPFPLSPFVTGRTPSRLSRCSLRTSRTPESFSCTSSLFEETLPTPVRTRRQTPRFQSRDNFYSSPHLPSYTPSYTGRNKGEDLFIAGCLDTQSSTLTAGSSVNSSQADTLILPKSIADSVSESQTLANTLVLEQNQESSLDAYERNLAEIILAMKGHDLTDGRDFLTDDVKSTDELMTSRNGTDADVKKKDDTLKTEDVFLTDDLSSQVDSVSSSSSSGCFSPRRSGEDSALPCTPATGCTPRYSMSRLSSSRRPQHQASKKEDSLKTEDVFLTDDLSSHVDSVSSSSSPSCFSSRGSGEDTDLPCTPGTGCTPRYSMSRLSSSRRPQHLANLSYTPGGRPLIQDLDEPVEYLYTDTEEGHKLIEIHIPPTTNLTLSSSMSTSSSDETILYDWKSMQTDVMKYSGKENQGSLLQIQKEENGDEKFMPETKGITDKELRLRLLELGESPGPISSRTRPTYMRRLGRLLQESNSQSSHQRKQLDEPQTDLGYSPELCRALQTFKLPDCHADDQALSQQFDQPDQNRKWREGIIKSSFNYLLLDPRVTKNLPFRSHTMTLQECFQTFIHAIFYVGKGKRSRPYSHLYEALDYFKGDKTSKKLCHKVQHILQVWNAEQGVVSLHCFQNVIPVEAYTREACMVEAIGLKMLTNQKRGDFYGVVSNWQSKQKRELGVHLLYRAMQIFLAEGERQLRPADIRQ